MSIEVSAEKYDQRPLEHSEVKEYHWSMSRYFAKTIPDKNEGSRDDKKAW